MAPKRRWSAVASRLPMRPVPDPHCASAMVELEGLRVCSSILPWKGCGSRDPWAGATTAERTIAAVAAVEANAPTVWGGAETGTTPCRAGSGRARGQGGDPCSKRSSCSASRCPPPLHHTRSRISSASTTSPFPSPGSSTKRTGIVHSSARLRSPTTTRTLSTPLETTRERHPGGCPDRGYERKHFDPSRRLRPGFLTSGRRRRIAACGVACPGGCSLAAD
jgi:hypothetical protein